MEKMEENERNAALATVLAELEADRAAIDAAITVIKRKMSGPVDVASLAELGSLRAGNRALAVISADIASDEFFGLSIKEAARKYLTMMKRKQSTKNIAAVLERGGLQHASKNFTTTVYSVLVRQSEFVRVGGDWSLAEWYPGRSKKPSKLSGVMQSVPDLKPSDQEE